MSNERPTMNEEQRKEALEKALARVKPVVEEEKKDAPVYDRLQKFTNKQDEAPHKEKEVAKDKDFSVYDLSEAINKNAKESEKIGLQQYDMPDKNKEKEKEKEKNKEKETERDKNPFIRDDKKSKEKDSEEDKNKDKEDEKDPVKKQKEKMKEMFSKVKLPSGMEIRESAGKWVLVDPDRKVETNVTDIINAIDKYNKEVDAANEENMMQNEAQSSIDKAADVNKKEEDMAIGNTEDKVATVSSALPKVKNIKGEQVFNNEDIEEVAKTALSASDEKALLERLADPKMLEEMEERERKNNRNADEKHEKDAFAKLYASRQNEGM